MFPLHGIASRLADHSGTSTPTAIGISQNILDASGFAPGTLMPKPVGVPDGLSYLTAGTGSSPAIVSLGTDCILKNFAVAGVVVWQEDQFYLLRPHGLLTLRLTEGCAPIEGEVALKGEICVESGCLVFRENGNTWGFQDTPQPNAPEAWGGEDIQ